MKEFLHNIDKLQKTLQNLQPLRAEDKKRLDKKFRLEFNYNAKYTKGKTLVYTSEDLTFFSIDDENTNNPKRERQELYNHEVALKIINQWTNDKDFELTEQRIKELNLILLVEPYYKDAITEDGRNTRKLIKVGGYKDQPNSVRLENGEMFHYTSPTDTPIEMSDLIMWYRANNENYHPIIFAALLHYKFVLIHPFDDGNGRISRLLANYILFKNRFPPLIIKSFDKDNYLKALNKADSGFIEDLISYFIAQVEWSLNLSINAANGYDIEEKDDWEKELDLIKRAMVF